MYWHTGDLVRKLREQEDWTQEELARRADVSIASIRRMEKGEKDQNRKTYARVGQAFNLTLGELYGLVPKTQTSGVDKSEQKRAPG